MEQKEFELDSNPKTFRLEPDLLINKLRDSEKAGPSLKTSSIFKLKDGTEPGTVPDIAAGDCFLLLETVYPCSPVSKEETLSTLPGNGKS